MVMFHDNFHDEALQSKIAIMIAERKALDKHVNDVKVIGVGYILTIVVCNSNICTLCNKFSIKCGLYAA